MMIVMALTTLHMKTSMARVFGSRATLPLPVVQVARPRLCRNSSSPTAQVQKNEVTHISSHRQFQHVPRHRQHTASGQSARWRGTQVLQPCCRIQLPVHFIVYAATYQLNQSTPTPMVPCTTAGPTFAPSFRCGPSPKPGMSPPRGTVAVAALRAPICSKGCTAGAATPGSCACPSFWQDVSIAPHPCCC